MKKKLTGIATLAAVGIALAGCAAGGVPAGGSAVVLDADAKLDGEITVWSWDVGAVALERLAADFEKAHEGTTENVVDVGYDNAYDKMSVGFQAGTGLPDVVTIETDAAPGYITQFPKGMLDLNPILGDDEADFDPFKWSAGSNAEGSLRIAPWDSGTVALYYRTDIIEQAGVDIEAVQTWDDLIAAGKVIKDKTGHTLLSTDIAAGGGFQMLLQQLGEGLFNDAGEITLDSPDAVRVLTMLQEMSDAGLIKNVTGWDGRVTSAKDGDSAVTAEAVWWIGTLQGDAPELSGKYAVLPLPAFDEGGTRTSNNGGSGLAVPAQAKNPQLAAAFVDFVLADADNQSSMMTNEGLFPSYLPALESDYFSEPVEYFSGQPVYETFADLTGQIPPIVYTSDSAEATDIVANAVSAAVLNGADPATVLADAAKQLSTSTGREVAKQP
jgi:lactose/L-arabinose transport system substrate-binding protein